MKIVSISLLNGLCVLKVYIYPTNSNWDLGVLTLSCPSNIVTWMSSCVANNKSSNVANNNYQLLDRLFFSRVVLIACTDVRRMQRHVSQGTPPVSPPWRQPVEKRGWPHPLLHQSKVQGGRKKFSWLYWGFVFFPCVSASIDNPLMGCSGASVADDE